MKRPNTDHTGVSKAYQKCNPLSNFDRLKSVSKFSQGIVGYRHMELSCQTFLILFYLHYKLFTSKEEI